MPELPEVEAVVRTLRPLVEGRRIRCVHVFHPIATKPQAASHVARQAQGRRIRAVDRKGKYVLLVLDRGLLTMHFRLDGQLLWFSNAKELLKHANQHEHGVHVDIALELQKGVLGFAHRRRANTLKPQEARRLHKAIVSLLASALECCLHPAPDFRNPEWWFQGLENILRAYGREGKPCRRCGESIRRIARGGRSTYCCGRCQK